jgi:hypothetical protein
LRIICHRRVDPINKRKGAKIIALALNALKKSTDVQKSSTPRIA